jgi:hypothetical protein
MDRDFIGLQGVISRNRSVRLSKKRPNGRKQKQENTRRVDNEDSSGGHDDAQLESVM